MVYLYYKMPLYTAVLYKPLYTVSGITYSTIIRSNIPGMLGIPFRPGGLVVNLERY